MNRIDTRPPRLKYRALRKIGLLNKTAMNLLCGCDDAKHVLVLEDEKGEIRLQPFFWKGLLGIVKIFNTPGQTSKLSLGCLDNKLKDGDYELVWDDVAERATLRRMECK